MRHLPPSLPGIVDGLLHLPAPDAGPPGEESRVTYIRNLRNYRPERNLYLPVTSFGTAKLADIPADSFLVADRRQKPIWIVEHYDGERYAVFLPSGEYDWHAFPIADNRNWDGPYVSAVRLVVNPWARAKDVIPGVLEVSGGRLKLNCIMKIGGIEDDAELDIGPAPAALGNTVAFSNWRLVYGEPGASVVLFSCDLAAGETSYPATGLKFDSSEA